ncbi:multi-sensor hybrid histidine kinase [[Leptolyngbya] sp. PCC 7376]|uniref:sensor histidine kinase n=1 Tax=[Leptolyngbya] sp. PCC 7376 TaxID=111781 RepID=UPI00029ECEE1|nr:ATP-binding protein [[Leptolyngbya] sp. PCC 7376]AFY40432.1 multi-sensor hybrid histidine kinase [[Leptolyngbya] sp. PCC 7376]
MKLASSRSRLWPLNLVLIVPFLVEISLAVGLTGYLSLRNGQRTVQELATQLQEEVGQRIDEHLNNYLEICFQVNQINLEALRLGLIDLNDPDSLSLHFWQQLRTFPTLKYIYFADEDQGGFVGAGQTSTQWPNIEMTENYQAGDFLIYRTNDRGKKQELIRQDPDYDPRRRDWYKASLRRQRMNWSDIYSFFPRLDLGITASVPLYDENNNVLGAFGTDISLDGLHHFLSELKPLDIGESFILDEDGRLIASSHTRDIFEELEASSKQPQPTRSLLRQTDDPLLRASGEAFHHHQMASAHPHVPQHDFVYDGQRYFVYFHDVTNDMGLKWIVGVILPESAFAADIQRNTRITIGLCILALVIAVFASIWTSSWIKKQIIQLVDVSDAIAQGELDKSIPLTRWQELDRLGQSLGSMALQLKRFITDLQQTNNRLEEQVDELDEARNIAEIASHHKSVFLANMSHEIRTPMNGVLGMLSLLSEDQMLNVEQRSRVEVAQSSAQSLLFLINDILDFSKIEAGKLALEHLDFDLHRFFERFIPAIAFRAEKKHLKLTLNLKDLEPALVRGDEGRFQQILNNLVGNALKFTEQGEIYIQGELTHTEQNIVFHGLVRDTGIGIAPDKLNSLFDAFTQEDRSTTRKYGGTGLGLAITKQLCDLMGGEIHVKSEVGIGSEFFFHVNFQHPVSEVLQAEPSTHVKQSKIADLSSAKTKRFLLAEDNQVNQLVMRGLFKKRGLTIEIANNGQEALEQLQSSAIDNKPYDLIFMDCQMPVMDGYEATQLIRNGQAGEQYQAVPIIAITANAMKGDREKCLSSGMNDYISKPINPQELERVVKEWLCSE